MTRSATTAHGASNHPAFSLARSPSWARVLWQITLPLALAPYLVAAVVWTLASTFSLLVMFDRGRFLGLLYGGSFAALAIAFVVMGDRADIVLMRAALFALAPPLLIFFLSAAFDLPRHLSRLLLKYEPPEFRENSDLPTAAESLEPSRAHGREILRLRSLGISPYGPEGQAARAEHDRSIREIVQARNRRNLEQELAKGRRT